jgi:hypothetical protein
VCHAGSGAGCLSSAWIACVAAGSIEQKAAKQRSIAKLAGELEALAPWALKDKEARRRIDDLFDEIKKLGKRLPDSLLSNIAQALVATEKD